MRKTAPLMLATAGLTLFSTVSGAFAVSVNAAVTYTETLPSGGHFMTASEALAIYGNQIPVTYYSYQTNDYETAIAEYVGSANNIWNPYGTFEVPYDAPCLWYQVAADTNNSPSYITVQLDANYSIFDTEYIYQICGCSTFHNISSDNYSSPSWLYNFNGQDTLFERTISGTVNYAAYQALYNGNKQVSWVEVNQTSNSPASGYSKRVRFYGNTGATKYIFISLPYVSGDAFGSSGTPASTSATTGVSVTVNVNVSVDNSDVISAVNAQGAEQSAAASAQQSQDAAYQESMLHGSTVQTETIATFNKSELEEAMTADIYDDLPGMIATSGFWLALLGHILKLVPLFSGFFAGFLCLNLLIYILWRK